MSTAQMSTNEISGDILAGRRKSLSWISAIGIGFWFLVGFPFGNHNESYYWVSLFEKRSFWEIVWMHNLASNSRPLGQGLAYIGWQLSGGGSWPIQLFSFVLAAVALRGIALALKETATFAVGMAVAGGVFFAGYIYLFHLHGIFYSPVLAFIAVILLLDGSNNLSSITRELAKFFCALAVGLLLHPYALILYIANQVGLFVESWRESLASSKALSVFLLLVTSVTLVVIRPRWHQMHADSNLQALLTSYRLNESLPLLSVLSVLFAVVTLLSIVKVSVKFRIGLACAAVFCAVMFAHLGLPVLLVWIGSAILKMAYLRRWSLAFLTAGAAVLPGIAASGSPTYAIFPILLSVIGLAWESSDTERVLLKVSNRWTTAVVLISFVLGGAVRIGAPVPVITKLSSPLLAEREKTEQLETVLKWMLESEYRTCNLRLEDATNPVNSAKQSIDRRHRPPTYQEYLDSYLASQRNLPSDAKTLVVTFGSNEISGMTRIYQVDGRFAGAAIVYK